MNQFTGCRRRVHEVRPPRTAGPTWPAVQRQASIRCRALDAAVRALLTGFVEIGSQPWPLPAGYDETA